MNAQTKNRIDISKKRRNGKKTGRWGRTDVPNMIERTWPDLGSIKVELEEFRFNQTIYQRGPNSWRQIPLGGKQPRKLILDVTWTLNEGVEILYAFDNKVVDASKNGPAPFEIPITWHDGPKKDSEPVPHLPGKGKRDFQLYLLNRKNGFIVQVDVTVVSRKGMFWLIAQEVTGAQVVRHPAGTQVDGLTSVEFGDYAYTMVPVYSENCYPGNDPVATWNRSYDSRADKVLGYAVEFGAFVSTDECSPGEWQPQWPTEVPQNLENKGYVPAVVKWFNLTGGYGFLQLKDGRDCFVHFTAIKEESGKSAADVGDFPVLDAMAGCYVKYQTVKENGQEKAKATAVYPA